MEFMSNFILNVSALFIDVNDIKFSFFFFLIIINCFEV